MFESQPHICKVDCLRAKLPYSHVCGAGVVALGAHCVVCSLSQTPLSRHRTFRCRHPQWTPVPESVRSNKLRQPHSADPLLQLHSQLGLSSSQRLLFFCLRLSTTPPSALPASTSVCVFACGRTGKQCKMKRTPAAHPRPKLFSEQKPHHRASEMGDFFVNPPLHTAENESLWVHQQGKWKNAVWWHYWLLLLYWGSSRNEWATEVGKECNREKNNYSERLF